MKITQTTCFVYLAFSIHLVNGVNENTRSTQLNPDIPNPTRYLDGKCPTIKRMDNIDIKRLEGHWYWYWMLYPNKYDCVHSYYLANKNTLYNTLESGFQLN